jgi:hypothetical protein
MKQSLYSRGIVVNGVSLSTGLITKRIGFSSLTNSAL